MTKHKERKFAQRHDGGLATTGGEKKKNKKVTEKNTCNSFKLQICN